MIPSDPLHAAVCALLDRPFARKDLVAELDGRRLHALSRLLQYRLATATDDTAIDRCRTALDQLSEAAAGRLLRDPAFCLSLRLGVSTTELADQIAAHAARADGPPGLACGLGIDISLPDAFDNPSGGMRRPRRPDAAETQAALARCDRALALLETDHPLGHALLSGLASNLVVRIDEARAGECWGATSGLAIGRVLIVNPAAAESDAHLAEALLHEATHVALDCAELQRPMLAPDARPDGFTMTSPWTGAPLSPHAFVHAVVVWATLLAFWSRRLEAEASDMGLARWRWIREGFDRFDPAAFSDLGDHLAPRAAEVARAATLAALDDDHRGEASPVPSSRPLSSAAIRSQSSGPAWAVSR